MSMTDKPVIDDYLNCLNILKNFRTKVYQQISRRYYELNNYHTHLFNLFFNKNIKELSPANEEEMKKMLIASLDLIERKVEISGCLMDLVSENNLKLDMNVKDVEITQTMSNKNPKIMSELEPNNIEIELNYTHNVLNGDNSNEDKTTLTENLQVNLDSNVQTIVTGTNKNIKNTTVNKNSKNSFNNNGNISTSSDSDIQPTYCICEDVSYGSMVCCDNDLCPNEWFHFRCVSLSRKPKGKWYCPNCRGTNSKTMKPREIFFEELKEYNKRKEENWSIRQSI